MEYTLEQKYESIIKELNGCKEKDPLKIANYIMKNEWINIHGPEHHFLDGASLMTAIRNNGFEMDLLANLSKLAERTIKMPGGMCGYWGICGSISSVISVFAILDSTGPLSNDKAYAEHMKLTSHIADVMSKIGGPRCCKRNATISISEAVKYANEHYGLNIPFDINKCEFSSQNKQCIGARCPFNK